MRVLATAFLILIAGQLEARVYQWVNSNTGNTQLSGKPPAWYRTPDGGPRVVVFENNQLIDDTSVKVDERLRVKLRKEAFEHAAEQQKRGMTSQEAIAKLEEQIKALIESPAMEEYLSSPEAAEDPLPELIADEPILREKVQRETPDERVERLKALISRWDERRTEEARSVLESGESGVDTATTDQPNDTNDDSDQ